MCGRYALKDELNDIISEYVAAGGDFRDWRPGFNLKPTNFIPVVLETAKGTETTRRLVEPARWSLVPQWSKELKLKYPTFNARSETAAEKPTFKASVKSKRCVIPATGYYEWKTEGKTKTPYFIHDPDSTRLNFAGLYTWWRASTEDDWLLTATILTREAVGELRGIHERTPLTLPDSMINDWLSPELDGDGHFVAAMVEEATAVAERLEFYQVAPLNGDGAELLNPL